MVFTSCCKRLDLACRPWRERWAWWPCEFWHLWRFRRMYRASKADLSSLKKKTKINIKGNNYNSLKWHLVVTVIFFCFPTTHLFFLFHSETFVGQDLVVCQIELMIIYCFCFPLLGRFRKRLMQKRSLSFFVIL